MMMRTLLALSLFASACTTASPSAGSSYESVRDRMSAGPTRLFVGGAESTGVVTARRWTASGWIEGDMPLVIDSGELAASVDESGKLSLAAFEVGVAPIDIPEEVFKKPAQLSDLRVKLTAAAVGSASWETEDAATATLSLALDLEWAIAINGGKTPLAAQHLPPVDVDFTLSGDGDLIDATVGLAASGELWDWAGLLEITHLELQLSAATVD